MITPVQWFCLVWLKSCRDQTRWSKKCSRPYCRGRRVLSSVEPNYVLWGLSVGYTLEKWSTSVFNCPARNSLHCSMMQHFKESIKVQLTSKYTCMQACAKMSQLLKIKVMRWICSYVTFLREQIISLCVQMSLDDVDACITWIYIRTRASACLHMRLLQMCIPVRVNLCVLTCAY